MHQIIDVKTTQNLAMTQRLQQAIHLLTFSNIELKNFVDEHVLNNPLLDLPDHEEEEPMNWHILKKQNVEDGDFIHKLAETTTLKGYILKQLPSLILSSQDALIAHVLTDALTPDGYLKTPIQEFALLLKVDESKIMRILEKLKTLEPVGVFAQDLTECLRLQLKDKGEWTPTFDDFLNNLVDLPRLGIEKIAKKLSVEPEQIDAFLKKIRRLDPKPGLQFDASMTHVLVPDVLIYKERDVFQVKLNPKAQHACFLNTSYYQELQAKCQRGDEISYLKDKKTDAHWLIQALEQRSVNLLKVTQAIVQRQNDFFEKGLSYLKPLTLKEIAHATDLHESTVSRITTQKYAQTPFGNLDLKFFFSSKLTASKQTKSNDVSSKVVQDKIKNLIKQEDPKNPLSDEDICVLLVHEGIRIARRTVAKYRTILKIGGRFERQRKI
ncbi:MAG: RNA polymerase sigma-54 factor 1 [Holosporales bacterium]